ncbi:MAG TPA: response regulator [Gemmatimonadales bacterium]|nr:response regulator [Gemmatimonadales bacterium]
MTDPADPPSDPQSDTILVLEDDLLVRTAMLRVLQHAGYPALGAANPIEAIQIAADHELAIRLLITDFGLHAVNGRQVADVLVRDRPGLRVLYISGHAEADVVPEGRRSLGVAFLQKPFTMDTFLRQVRELLV